MAPMRSRQQVLEDKSGFEFGCAIPEEWVVRDVPKDYGIDREVEIFEGEHATALMFKVQLKAKATLKGKKPSQSVKLSHIRYWIKLDMPVLIVLFVEDENVFYCKWAESHDPGPISDSVKSTTVNFTEDDLLVNRIAYLPEEIELLREVRAGRIPTPVPLRIISSLGAVSHYQLIREFRAQLTNHDLNDLVMLVTNQQQPALTATLTQTVTRVAMPLNARSISLHALGVAYDFSSDANEITQNTLSLLGFLLSKCHRPSEAIRLLRAFPSCSALTLPEVATEYGGAMLQSGQPEPGVTVADRMVARLGSPGSATGDDRLLELAQMFLGPAILKAELLSNEDGVVRVLQDLALRFEASGEVTAVGAMHFNLANVFRRRARYGDAVAEFDIARAYKRACEDSPEFFTLLGTAAFRSREYERSTAAYRRAITLGARDVRTQMHLADALFWSGEFGESLRVIEGEYGEPLNDRLSVVNRHAIHEIIHVSGLERQSRRPLTEQERELVSERDPATALRLICEADALESMLWVLIEPDTSQWTLSRSILLSRLNLQSGLIWAMATVMSYLSEESRESIFPYVVEMAINDASDDYLDALPEVLEDAPQDIREPILNYAHSVASTFENSPERLLILWTSPEPADF